MISARTFWLLLPEIILTMTAVFVIVAGAFHHSKYLWPTCTLVGLAVAAATFWASGGLAVGGMLAITDGPVVFDALSGLSRLLGLAVGAGLVLTFGGRAQRADGSDVLGMILLTVLGMMLVGSASDVLVMFLALELISIPTYMLLFVGRADRASSEASIKYFLLSIVSSTIFLLGVSLLYGAAGTLQFAQLGPVLDTMAGESAPRILLLAYLLIFTGLCFKIAAVPFHFYAPDVYSAATNANAGLLAVVPKIAGLVAIFRMIAVLVPVWDSFGWQVALILSILTMTVGNVSALWQTDIRRMLGYSSIAHAGYMLIGVAVAMARPEASGLFDGLVGAMLYVVVYSVATLGAFAVLAAISDRHQEVTQIVRLSGLYRQRPLMAAAWAVCMFSLAGIPPLPGFWGKFGLFGGAVEVARQGGVMGGWFGVLAVVAALNAAIGAVYYLRVVAVSCFGGSDREEAGHRPIGFTLPAAWAAVASGVVLVIIGGLPGPLVGQLENVEARVVAPAASDEPIVTASFREPIEQHDS